MGSILILYLARERHLGAEAIGFAFSIGFRRRPRRGAHGGPVTRRVGVGRMLVVTSIGFSLAGLPVAFAPDALIWPAVALSGFLGGFCGVGWNINQVSLAPGDHARPRMQGKMNATMRFIVWGTMPVGLDQRRRARQPDRPPPDDLGGCRRRARRVPARGAVVGPQLAHDAGAGRGREEIRRAGHRELTRHPGARERTRRSPADPARAPASTRRASGSGRPAPGPPRSPARSRHPRGARRPCPGRVVRTRSSFRAASSVPSATTTIPACWL